LPALLVPAEAEVAALNAHDATAARMLRELTDALEVLTAARPLVLVLEDLHWSDRATLAWLAYLARRRDPARVLILGTYRAREVLGCAQPLQPFLAALQPHPQCRELMLDTLVAPAVTAYLSQRCASAMLPAGLPRLIHERTSGHPLFLVAIVDELIRQKRIEAIAERVDHNDLPGVIELVPANLRQYIEQQLDRLSGENQTLLAAASTAGETFAVAAAAAGVAQTVATIEARYAALARQAQFIRESGTETWPDGTVTACYRFKHALYHEVVYARVPADHRMQLHRQIGERKETGYGAQARTVAAELAAHFSRGADYPRAVHYLHCAAVNALQRSAYQEAIGHLTQGLEALASLPDTRERAQRELEVLTTLGLALVATEGQAHESVERTYARARTLCDRLAAPKQLPQVLCGLFSFHAVRAQFAAAWDVGQHLLALAERPPDTALRMVAHFALGQTSLFQGRLVLARAHLEQGIALYDPEEHHGLSARAGFPGDLGVFCRCFAAHTLWHLGYPDQALQGIHQALALAQERPHPFSRALALAYAAMLHQFRREEHLAQETAQAAVALCREQGFPYYLAWGTILQGWALTAMQPGEEGMAQMRDGMAAIRATGARLRWPYYLALLADACARTREPDAALAMLAEGLAEARRHGECWQEAELHRLQGELSLLRDRQGLASQVNRGSYASDAAAEGCFHRALRVARQQRARSLELRAALSLARVWQRKGKRVAAYRLLAPVYDWFTEGFDTADLQDVRLLLDELG
jgi:predicted ATPase